LVLPKKEENLLLSILTVETKPNSQPQKKGQKRGKKLKKRKRERERERERERILQIHTSMEVWQAAR
jgi:hypothetical protein